MQKSNKDSKDVRYRILSSDLADSKVGDISEEP